jgi:hypothetical protein
MSGVGVGARGVADPTAAEEAAADGEDCAAKTGDGLAVG